MTAKQCRQFIFTTIHSHMASLLLNKAPIYCSFSSLFCQLTASFKSRFLFQLTHQLATYLHNLIFLRPPRNTQSSSVVTLARPPTHSSLKITSRSFRYASPHLWNQLPHSFRQPCLDLYPSDSPYFHDHLTSSVSPSPLLSSITPSFFHSHLSHFSFFCVSVFIISSFLFFSVFSYFSFLYFSHFPDFLSFTFNGISIFSIFHFISSLKTFKFFQFMRQITPTVCLLVFKCKFSVVLHQQTTSSCTLKSYLWMRFRSSNIRQLTKQLTSNKLTELITW